MHPNPDLHLSIAYPSTTELVADLKQTLTYLNLQLYDTDEEFKHVLHEAIGFTFELYERLYNDANTLGFPYEH